MATVPSKPNIRFDLLPKEGRHASKLRRDRMIAVLVVAGMIAVFALVIWLASLNGTAPSGDFYDYDFWMAV